MELIYPHSFLSITEEENGAVPDYVCNNESVLNYEHLGPGIDFFEAKDPKDGEVLLLFSGWHGDELCPTRILDELRRQLCEGLIELKKNVLFVDGNLKAMQQALDGMRNGVPAFARYFNPDLERLGGLVANGNRRWQPELLESDKDEGYIGNRRFKVSEAIKNVLRGGSDIQAASVEHTAYDNHESFSVPTVRDVRGEYSDDSEYTYGMDYTPNFYFSERLSSVLAGVVKADPEKSETCAAYLAREYNANAITLEMGSINSKDSLKYAPEYEEYLKNILEGNKPKTASVTPDHWIQEENIMRSKGVSNFGFYGESQIFSDAPVHKDELDFGVNKEHGRRVIANKYLPPKDFIPLNRNYVIPKGDDEYYRLRTGEVLLFANSKVGEGDRAAVKIRRVLE